MGEIWSLVKGWKALLVVVLTPLLLLPLPIIINTPEGKTAFVLLLMAVYWVTESLPIAVTALIPALLFPMLGVIPAKVIAKSYMSDLLLVFLGGLALAVTIERWNLHRRIALRILLFVGPEPRWLMLGLMCATWFLSMWISNTATTAMMIPITEAILQQMKRTAQEPQQAETNGVNHSIDNKEINVTVDEKSKSPPEATSNVPTSKHFRLLCKGMSLSICYAANSGGIATLTGTGPNLILKENADVLYADHGEKSPVNFATWMGFGLPLSALVLLVCWLWLQVAFLRCRGVCTCCGGREGKKEQGQRVRGIIQDQYNKLGPVTFAEGAVLFWFIVLVVLWISRDLGGAGGWGSLFPPGSVSDATPAMLVGICLFFFPSQLPYRGRQKVYSLNEEKSSTDLLSGSQLQPLLRWSDAHAKIPWSLFWLLGGGFALSEGCKQSGLSSWMGQQLEVLSGIDRWGMLFILCYLAAGMTEVTSNTAISILLMPILSDLALRTGVHPLYYMFPATLACSFAFMLPVATPPNAIVFSYGHVKVVDMMLAGLVMNILAVPLLILATGTWGDAMFDFQNLPSGFVNSTGLNVTSGALSSH